MLKGKVHKYGADVNTDVIIPARYLNIYDPVELAKHCMEDIDEDFLKKVEPGDIIMATTNFGCGSSREHAPMAIKAAGISCVIAKTFARIFFRNAINIGLPLLECEEAVDNTESGDVLEVDLSKGEIRNITRKLTFTASPYPDFM
ncbi:MAG: 3-isopropylmalate dehydratase small subunit, partial [Dehalococcoidales bacterium]